MIPTESGSEAYHVHAAAPTHRSGSAYARRPPLPRQQNIVEGVYMFQGAYAMPRNSVVVYAHHWLLTAHAAAACASACAFARTTRHAFTSLEGCHLHVASIAVILFYAV